jgi:hypothetical protein
MSTVSVNSVVRFSLLGVLILATGSVLSELVTLLYSGLVKTAINFPVHVVYLYGPIALIALLILLFVDKKKPVIVLWVAYVVEIGLCLIIFPIISDKIRITIINESPSPAENISLSARDNQLKEIKRIDSKDSVSWTCNCRWGHDEKVGIQFQKGNPPNPYYILAPYTELYDQELKIVLLNDSTSYVSNGNNWRRIEKVEYLKKRNDIREIAK